MAVAEASSSAILFSTATDRRLSDIYASCVALILQLRVSLEFGEPEVLRKRIVKMLEEARQEALRAGIPAEDVRAAQFAVVAFLDETILSSQWASKEAWLANPLQLEQFGRFDAGEEFFVKLEDLRAQPAGRAELLEVYYLCMALGFKGRYQLYEQEKFRNLVEDVYAELSRVPGMSPGGLSPHGTPHDQVATEVKGRLPAWVVAVIAVVLGVAIYVGMSLYISRTADDTAQLIRALPHTTMTE